MGQLVDNQDSKTNDEEEKGFFDKLEKDIKNNHDDMNKRRGSRHSSHSRNSNNGFGIPLDSAK